MAGFEDLAKIAGGPIGQAVSTGTQALVGVAQLISAGRLKKEAKDLQGRTVRPNYNVQQPILDNQSLAEREASQGLSDAAMLVYENNMSRNLGNSIDAILRGGGSLNSIGDLYDTAEDNAAQLALLEEEVRRKNIHNYVSQNEKLAGELDKEFQINQWAPYKDTIQAIAKLREQAAANKSAGLNTIASAFGNFATGSKLAAEGRGGSNAGGAPGTAAASGVAGSFAQTLRKVATNNPAPQRAEPTPMEMADNIYRDMYYKNYGTWE